MNQKRLEEELPIVRPEGVPETAILRVLRVPGELAGMRHSAMRSSARTRSLGLRARPSAE